MPRLKKMTPIINSNKEQAKRHIKLAELLKKRKVRQYMLAEYLGVKQGTISMWKTGRTPLPSCYVYDICIYLKTTPNELFGWNK